MDAAKLFFRESAKGSIANEKRTNPNCSGWTVDVARVRRGSTGLRDGIWLRHFRLQSRDIYSKCHSAAGRGPARRVSVHLIDVDYPYDASPVSQEVYDRVVSLSPDVVGLSCFCWSADALLDLGSRVLERLPNALILAGGPSAGPVARDLLAVHESLHAVARGEGEPVFLSLCRALCAGASLDTVVGLTWRDASGAIRENPDPPLVDVALVPSPYRLGIQSSVCRSMLLDTCRGCKYRCQFCMFMGLGRKLRYVPIALVEADLRWGVEHGVRSVRLNDGAVNYDTDRLRELAAAINRADPNGQLRFHYFVKLELLTREQVDILATIPTAEVLIGAESLTPSARRSMSKLPLATEYFASQLLMLEKIGPVTCTLLMGLPGDTVAGLVQTLSWIRDFDRAHPDLFHMICLLWVLILPGSRSHELRDRLGFRCQARGLPYVLQSDEHDPDTFLHMARVSVEYNYAQTKLLLDFFPLIT